jgi:hypothetical protein
MSNEKRRLEAAERMIDAVVDKDVDLGIKARHFFGEYRHAFPKKENMPSTQTAEERPTTD